MKIAVIGGGIAGLATAWLLSRRNAVTLFERHAQPGFVASSVAVDAGPGVPPVRVDVPLRVFYPGYYPTLTRLYAQLGVATEPVSYATTFTGADGRAFFRWRNLRWGDACWPYVLPQDLAGARARRIVRGALRFSREARAALARGELAGCSIGSFVAALALPPDYVDGLLLPTLATIATCTTEDARHYPADVVATYLAGGLTRQSVRRAVLGADDACARLQAGITRVQCDAGVVGLRREDAAGKTVLVQRLSGVESFDHVVLATQANQALALWQDATAEEAAALQGFSYRALEVVMHRDASLMPARRADWSPVNARVCAGQDRPESTIWVNAVQPALRHAPLALQTVQPQRPVRDDLVISRARFERPLVDAASQRALAALQQLQARPGRRVWLCGSYAQPGVPLLESAVRSACAVAEAITGRPALERLAA
jgi:predicted NAD/FAD-binding protein